MRGVYESAIHIAGLNALKTLMLFEATSSKCVEILSASISNATNTTNQQLESGFYKITTLGSPTGTSITPSPMEQGDQAASTTVLGNCTAEPTTYSTTVYYGSMGWASLAGYQFAPVPEERPVIPPSGNWGLKLTDTVPTAFDADVIVRFREIG